MKKSFALLLLGLSFVFASAQKVDFNKYFVDKQLRIDYTRSGNAYKSDIYIFQYKLEPYWGGPKGNLVDTFNYGEFRVQVFDKTSGILIFSKTFSTLFGEWQATSEATQVNRSFFETVNMPFPKNNVIVKFQKSTRLNNYEDELNVEINPKDLVIRQGLNYKFKVVDILNNGTTESKVDLVFLAEGYTIKEEKKFMNDAKKFADYLFSYEPFKSQKENFNIRAIFSFSTESGTDIPQNGIWANTLMNSSFNTFGTDRYLTTLDSRNVYDIAALAPYDQVCILVNTKKYGGGGFYNFFNLTSAQNEYSKEIFVHEFGHSFGGLADEYYDNNDAFDTLYNLNVEPREPNITTLKSFDKKWKDIVDKNTPIPTPAEENNTNIVGAFEGGGYQAKGIYRPVQYCLMKELRSDFCPVCSRAIVRMIDFLTH